MHLYHYRSVKSALLEITNGTFHFAGREELNDPLSENEAERIIKVLDASFKIGDMISKMEQRSMNEKERFNLMETVETYYIDKQILEG